MSDKNIEMMKKLLEKKKAEQKTNKTTRPDKKIGSKHSAHKTTKTGGAKKV